MSQGDIHGGASSERGCTTALTLEALGPHVGLGPHLWRSDRDLIFRRREFSSWEQHKGEARGEHEGEGKDFWHRGMQSTGEQIQLNNVLKTFLSWTCILLL